MGNSCAIDSHSEWEDSSMSDDSKQEEEAETHAIHSTEAFREWIHSKYKHIASGRKRWTVLTDDGSAKQSIATPSDRQIVLSTDDEDATVFTIHFGNRSRFVFKTATVEQRDEWMALLRQHREYEDNDQYEVNVLDDDDSAKIVVQHIATKQRWSAGIANESQRELLQTASSAADWRLEVDAETFAMTLSLNRTEALSMVLAMDQIEVTRTATNDDGPNDDDRKEPEIAEPELTEQQRKNMTKMAEYTFTVHPVADSEALRIAMNHKASGSEFAVTLGPNWPWKRAQSGTVAVHDEDAIDESIDGAAVNKLFGNEESSDDDEDDDAAPPVPAQSVEDGHAVHEEAPAEEELDPFSMEGVLDSISRAKGGHAMEVALNGSGKTANLELRFEAGGEAQCVVLPLTEDSIRRLVEAENLKSYGMYSIAMEFAEETNSLLIEMNHLESGRDFEVKLCDEWLREHCPEKHRETMHPVVDSVNALFGTEDSSDEEEEEEPSAEEEEEEEAEAERGLFAVMECIEKCKASNTLQITMKGAAKKESIDLRFTLDGNEELIEVRRTSECIQKQIEMEQKEEMQLEAQYISGIRAVADSGYGQYCAIEGLADRHSFKQHKDDHPDPQSVNSRKIMRELRRTLAKGVYLSFTAGSMFVRFDEANPRFLQAMLVGLKGTPYFNGLFLFDIYLGAEYPAKPCEVKHVTNGAQLCHANNGPGGFSPNLHQSTGKVCLSLLGTWSGPGWEANQSNVYQLLSTLLLMVFGAEHPYYMEPGHGGWEGTAIGKTHHDPRVIEYDEEVLFHTAKSAMLDILRTPYPGFEDVIRTNFRLKATQIRRQMDEVLRCEDYSEKFRKRIQPIYEQIDAELERL